MHPSALRTVHSALVVLLPSQVAAELEEAQELEGRNRSVQLLQLQQKVSSLELERMQSQLTCMRVEDQLNESRIQRTELAKRLAVAEERLVAVTAQRDQALSSDPKPEQSLRRELIITRFHLTTALRANAAAVPAGIYSAEELIAAAASNNLEAVRAILSPRELLSVRADACEEAVLPIAPSAPAPSTPPSSMEDERERRRGRAGGMVAPASRIEAKRENNE